MKLEKVKRFLLFCEPCSFKKILGTNTPEDMTPIKTSPVPGGAPKLDPKSGKTLEKKSLNQHAKVKCPQCGRGVTIKPLPDVYSKSYDEIDKREQQAKEAAEKKKRIEDGTPPKLDLDFLG